MCLVFTRMPDESYRTRLRSLLLRLCYVFRALINSLVSWFYTNALGSFCYRFLSFYSHWNNEFHLSNACNCAKYISVPISCGWPGSKHQPGNKIYQSIQRLPACPSSLSHCDDDSDASCADPSTAVNLWFQVCSLLMAHCLMRYIVTDVKLFLW